MKQKISGKKLSCLISELRYDEAKEVGLAMVRSDSILDFQNEIIEGLHQVEMKYNDGQLFIADLIVAGSLVREIFALTKDSPFMKHSVIFGKVVIGTISGDIHNIGKDLFADALRYRGVNIIDLGVDVPIDQFLDAVTLHRPDILAVSTCIDSSLSNTKTLINRLRGIAAPPDMKIIVGGSVVDERFTKIPGVDYISRDYQRSIEFCVEVLKKKTLQEAGLRV
jgi:methanogenic corrinoid protein MtbC1